MTPFELRLLLHMFVSPSPPEGSAILAATLTQFLQSGLVQNVMEGEWHWKLTPKGEAFCRSLCMAPVPVMRFVIPAQDERVIS